MSKLPAPPHDCPLCGEMWSAINEHNNAHCCECGMSWSDMEDFHHVGQWMDVDGEPVHVLADPNMSDKTRHALDVYYGRKLTVIDDGDGMVQDYKD